MKTIPFTKAGYEQLQQEQKDIAEKRKEAVEDLSKARAMGDLSENGYYKAARFKLTGIDRRIREIKYLLRFGKIIQKSSGNTITEGSTVVLSDKTTDTTYMLVGEYEVDPLNKKISSKSLLGSILMGKKVGDTAELSAPKGKQTFIIKKVS